MSEHSTHAQATRHSGAPDPGGAVLRLDCDDCTAAESPHCSDCIVTHLCREHDGSVVVMLDEMRLVRRLQDAGLVPPNRHRRRCG